MLGSQLIITQTFLQEENLIQDLVYSFFNKNQIRNFWETANTLSREGLASGMNFHLDRSRLFLPEFRSKEDFRSEIMSFYRNYSEACLLVLGNLQKFSLSMQEGMLKLLEEPPHNLTLVLLAHNSQEVLPTIISRCQKVFLPHNYIFQNLNQEKLDISKKKFPEPRIVIQELIKNKTDSINALIPELKNLDRSEINFWLWQLLISLEKVYHQFSIDKVSQLIEQTAKSMQLNQQNIQKKLVLTNLLVS